MPRIPCMSMVPSSFASTDLSWMPRFCATAATPAVKQLARPTSTYSTGVAPRSSDAKTSGWSASNENSVLCFCSSPSPWKPCSFVWLCVPFCHLQDALHVNLAACGALFSASRAASSASTLTPLLTIVSAIVTPLVTVKGRASRFAQVPDHTSAPCRWYEKAADDGRPLTPTSRGYDRPHDHASVEDRRGVRRHGRHAVPRSPEAACARLWTGAASDPHY